MRDQLITYLLFLQRLSEQDNKFENILYDLYYKINIVVKLPDFGFGQG